MGEMVEGDSGEKGERKGRVQRDGRAWGKRDPRGRLLITAWRKELISCQWDLSWIYCYTKTRIRPLFWMRLVI
jgi:hypothetical protein